MKKDTKNPDQQRFEICTEFQMVVGFLSGWVNSGFSCEADDCFQRGLGRSFFCSVVKRMNDCGVCKLNSSCTPNKKCLQANEWTNERTLTQPSHLDGWLVRIVEWQSMNVLFARADNNHIKSQLKYLFWHLLGAFDENQTKKNTIPDRK